MQLGWLIKIQLLENWAKDGKRERERERERNKEGKDKTERERQKKREREKQIKRERNVRSIESQTDYKR